MSGALPPLSSPFGSFFASLLSVVFSFGSPEVSFLWFVVSSGLLYLLCTLHSLSLLQLLSPTPVPDFRFPFLLVPCCFRIRQGCFPCFLMVSSSFRFLLCAVCLSSHSALTCWFALVPPFLCFSLGVLFFLARLATPARVLVSVFACRLLRLFLASCHCPILDIGFAFSFLSCLLFFRSFPLPFTSVFLAYPSFSFSDRVSLHAALLFSSTPFGSLALASGLRCPPLRFICFGRLFLVGFLSPFPTFIFCSFSSDSE